MFTSCRDSSLIGKESSNDNLQLRYKRPGVCRAAIAHFYKKSGLIDLFSRQYDLRFVAAGGIAGEHFALEVIK